VPGHGPIAKSHFVPRLPSESLEFPKLRFSQLWRPITLCVNLRLKWDLKQSCSPFQELFNGMLHATCTKRNRGNSRLLVVGSQIANLTPNLSFGHNLSNGFWPLQLFFEDSKVHQDSNSQSGSSLGSVRVHSLTLSYTPRSMRCDSQASFLARTLANPCFGREPKARVATLWALEME